jgi:hypothetical protein
MLPLRIHLALQPIRVYLGTTTRTASIVAMSTPHSIRPDTPAITGLPERPAKPGILLVIARIGYAARGVVYATIGFLALLVAVGRGGDVIGPRGAIRELAAQPAGAVVAVALAMGLAAYALWRLLQGIRDVNGHGTTVKGLCVRSGMVGSAFIHLGWAILALGLAIGHDGSGSEDAAAQGWTARTMAQPFGRWLVAACGIGIAIFGLNHFRKAARASFMKQLAVESMRQRMYTLSRILGRMGLTARGALFCVIGVFVVIAALRFDPQQARGLSASMLALLEQPFGAWLFAGVAAGVLAFGCYNAILARYFIIRPGRGQQPSPPTA